ncbi:hypothetical protein [Halomicrobium katesii]|uniref:hypothetical protein n=1 Tax=Halomicrobium katesii TaxID=437163 RepID=UPI0012BA72EC|nr:hypothetical protein [Halomicrobium katesii]
MNRRHFIQSLGIGTASTISSIGSVAAETSEVGGYSSFKDEIENLKQEHGSITAQSSGSESDLPPAAIDYSKVDGKVYFRSKDVSNETLALADDYRTVISHSIPLSDGANKTVQYFGDARKDIVADIDDKRFNIDLDGQAKKEVEQKLETDKRGRSHSQERQVSGQSAGHSTQRSVGSRSQGSVSAQALIRKVVGLYQIDRMPSCGRLGKRLQLSV